MYGKPRRAAVHASPLVEPRAVVDRKDAADDEGAMTFPGVIPGELAAMGDLLVLLGCLAIASPMAARVLASSTRASTTRRRWR